MTDVSATLVAKLAHLRPTDEVVRTLAQRAELVALSDASAEAVLGPDNWAVSSAAGTACRSASSGCSPC